MAGTPPQPVPQPRPRRKTGNPLRKKYVETFAGFNTVTVSDEQVQAARDCIQNGGPPSTRYVQVPFDVILNQNKHKDDHLTMMTSAYDLLLKYVINLMKPRRPHCWRSIKTNNPAFRARVACMEGAKDILKTVGYSVVTETAMEFPENTNEPNRKLLEAIAAELLMAKLEVDEMNTQQQPPPQQQLEQPHTQSDHALMPRPIPRPRVLSTTMRYEQEPSTTMYAMPGDICTSDSRPIPQPRGIGPSDEELALLLSLEQLPRGIGCDEELALLLRQEQLHQHAAVSEKFGWVCVGCMFTNKPRHLWCEQCGATRPEDYVLPTQEAENEQLFRLLLEQKEVRRRQQEEDEELARRLAEELQKQEIQEKDAYLVNGPNMKDTQNSASEEHEVGYQDITVGNQQSASVDLIYPPHHKFDARYPGLCFFGDAHHEIATTEGQVIKWEDIGVDIDIPPGAVSEQTVIDVSVRPCLSGPFEIPDGIDLASPLYLVRPAFTFRQEIKFSLQHFINLEAPEDCKEMTFLLASSTPRYTASEPKYLLREVKIQKGAFTVGNTVATVFLKHFCLVGIGRKRTRLASEGDSDIEISVGPPKRLRGNNRYSARLYWNWQSLSGGQETNMAVFAVCLCHPLHVQNLDKLMEQQFGKKPLLTKQEPICLSGDVASLFVPRNVPGWKLSADRTTKISKSELDLPLYEPEYAQFSGYPPTIHLTISHVPPSAHDQIEQMETDCKLKVLGLKEEVEFCLPLPKACAKPVALMNSGLPSAYPSKDPYRDYQNSTQLSENFYSKRPTLCELLKLPCKGRYVSLPAEIGSEYTVFGILLLQDDNGSKICDIANKHRDDGKKIVIEILQEWLVGSGKQPVTWQTLAEVLKDSEFSELAKDIELMKC